MTEKDRQCLLSEKAYGKASEKYDDLWTERRIIKADKMEAAERKIDAELESLYGERLASLKKKEDEAHQAFLAEKEKLAAKNLPFPVGTKLRRWVRKSYGYRFGSWEKDVFGVIEICTRETRHPGNLKYTAEVGTVLVRHLNKDGKPGRQYSRYGRNWKELWLPEGEKPKEKP